MHGVDKISHGIAGGDPEGAARPTLQEQRAADYSMRGHPRYILSTRCMVLIRMSMMQVAIKKVLQDKRFKNRELQIMKMMDHCNVVQLQHCFYTTTEKDEVFLNLVLEFVPETVYRIGKHYSKNGQRMPTLFVKLYVYQVHCMWFIASEVLVLLFHISVLSWCMLLEAGLEAA